MTIEVEIACTARVGGVNDARLKIKATITIELNMWFFDDIALHPFCDRVGSSYETEVGNKERTQESCGRREQELEYHVVPRQVK